MNTLFPRSARRLPAVIFAIATTFLFLGEAHARPADPTWFGPPKVKPLPPQACGPVWGPAGYGPASTGPKAIWVIERDLGPCPKTERPVTRYVGPRNTIPVRD
jgi:hypothetical protein